MKRSTKLLPLILSALLITGCNNNKSVEPDESNEPEISERAPESQGGGQTSRGGQQTSQGGGATSKTPVKVS